jgi:hypothetical protein
LKLIGINSGTVAAWMRDGVLLATGNPHVFRRTPEATRRIAAKLAR